MWNFQDALETHKWSFFSAFSISMTLPLRSAVRLSKIVNMIGKKLTDYIILPFYQNHKRPRTNFQSSQ